MTRIQRLLHDSRLCWLLSFVIWVLIAVWAPLLKFDPRIPTNEEMAMERKHVGEMCHFLGPISTRAKKLFEQRRYTPTEYFDNIEKILLKDRKLGFPGSALVGRGDPISSSTKTWLNEMMEANRRSSSDWRATEREYQEQSRIHTKWMADNKFYGAASEELGQTLRRIGIVKICWWFVIFYLRMMPLSALLFLVRMSQRKGILQTILSDKKAFLLAVLAWPYGLVRYPYNIVREIRVEAELRRLGKLFRWLTPDEREKVREVANSSAYRPWIVEHRRLNAGLPQRWLLVALLGTVLLNLILPVLGSQSHTRPIRGPAEIHQTIRDGTGLILYESPSQDHQDQDGGACRHWVCPTNLLEVSQPDTICWIVQVETLLTNVFARAVDHVPVSRPAVSIASN